MSMVTASRFKALGLAGLLLVATLALGACSTLGSAEDRKARAAEQNRQALCRQVATRDADFCTGSLRSARSGEFPPVARDISED